MIEIKITMVSGKEYKIRNFEANNLLEFTRLGLKVSSNIWYEILPGELINVNNIESLELFVEEVKDEVPEELGDKEEVILPKDKENEEVSKKVVEESA